MKAVIIAGGLSIRLRPLTNDTPKPMIEVAGQNILEPEIFKYIPAGVFCDFGKHVFPDLLKKGVPIQTYIIPHGEAVFGADTFEYLEKTREYFVSLREL